jgi:electron transport complex protein RnfG
MSEPQNDTITVGTMVKLGVTLAVYAVISCALLAVVNNFTAPVIEANQIAKANAGMKAVFADADSFEQVTDFTPSTDSTITIDKFYLAKVGGDVKGAVVQATGPTYDHGTIVVGVDLAGTVKGMQFLALSDSPGFGLKANDATYKVKSGTTFYGQFAGKKVADGFTAGQTYDAVTGATITSKGVGKIMTMATFVASSYLAEKCGGAAVSGAAPVVEESKLFSFEDAVVDINSNYKAYDGLSVSEDVPFDTKTPIHNMLVNRVALVKDAAGKVVEAAVSVSGQTYSDNGGTVIAVVDANRKIVGARIIALQDSPNRGQEATKASFYNKFAGDGADDDLRSGTSYDALSGASITSDCIADMVKVASYTAADIMAQHGGAKAPAGSETYTLNNHYLEE